MKKLFFSLLFISALAIFASAQEKTDGSYKPESGFTTEVNFYPANTSMPISLNSLKGRMFLNPNMAVRLGLDLNMHSNSSTVVAEDPANPNEETSNSYFVFGLHPGIEMHMGDLPRLSPYVGAELGFTTKSSKTEIKNFDNVNNQSVETKNVWFNESNPGYTEISFNILIGTDYYICKHLYCGAEVGLGFASTTYKEQELTSIVSNVSTTIKIPESKSMNLGVNFVPAIRLGWAIN